MAFFSQKLAKKNEGALLEGADLEGAQIKQNLSPSKYPLRLSHLQDKAQHAYLERNRVVFSKNRKIMNQNYILIQNVLFIHQN